METYWAAPAAARDHVAALGRPSTVCVPVGSARIARGGAQQQGDHDASIRPSRAVSRILSQLWVAQIAPRSALIAPSEIFSAVVCQGHVSSWSSGSAESVCGRACSLPNVRDSTALPVAPSAARHFRRFFPRGAVACVKACVCCGGVGGVKCLVRCVRDRHRTTADAHPSAGAWAVGGGSTW